MKSWRKGVSACSGWEGWGSSKWFWHLIARVTKGLLNLVKESRVCLEGNVESLKCLRQGQQIRFALPKNYSGFRVEIGLEEGT